MQLRSAAVRRQGGKFITGISRKFSRISPIATTCGTRGFERAAVKSADPDAACRASDIVSEKRGFRGRDYVFAQIDDFPRQRARVSHDRKTLASARGNPREVRRARQLPVAFNDRALGINTPRHVLKSICAQVIRGSGCSTRVPVRGTRDGAFLVKILREAARTLSGGERLVLRLTRSTSRLGTHIRNILFLSEATAEHVYFGPHTARQLICHFRRRRHRSSST